MIHSSYLISLQVEELKISIGASVAPQLLHMRQDMGRGGHEYYANFPIQAQELRIVLQYPVPHHWLFVRCARARRDVMEP